MTYPIINKLILLRKRNSLCLKEIMNNENGEIMKKRSGIKRMIKKFYKIIQEICKLGTSVVPELIGE